MTYYRLLAGAWLLILNCYLSQYLLGQANTKIYSQITSTVAPPIKLNDSMFMTGINLSQSKNRNHCALQIIDSNGNFSEFKHLCRKNQSDTFYLSLTNVHLDKQGNFCVFGSMGYRDQNSTLGFMLKMDSNGNKVLLKYYKGTGPYIHFEQIIYDTVTNSFLCTGTTESDTPDLFFSFVMRIDTKGDMIAYNTFKEAYHFVQIKHNWNSIILSGAYWEPVDSQFEEVSPVIRYLRIDNLESKWKHPLFYNDMKAYFGYNTYPTDDGYIYFNADATNGSILNNHIIKLDTNGVILNYTSTCSKDSSITIHDGYRLNDTLNIEIGEYRQPPYTNWECHFLIRKSSINGNVYNEWIWDSTIDAKYFSNILKTKNNTYLISFNMWSNLYTPLVIMKFDSDLKRIPFDGGAKPMEYLPNIKKGDTLYVDGGTDTIYIINKTSKWENLSEKTIKTELSVYPNPASNILHINNLPNTKIPIVLYDILGKKIFTISTNGEELYQISTNHLPRGLYILCVGDDKIKIILE